MRSSSEPEEGEHETRPRPRTQLIRGLLTFLVFVQVRDVCALLRAHGFGADEVAHGLLLAVDLAEGAVQVPLPVDLIAVDLVGKSTLGSNTGPKKTETRSLFIWNNQLWEGRCAPSPENLLTSAKTNGVSCLRKTWPERMALTEAGPQRKVPWLVSWGVESTACQPPCPGGRSGLAIQQSFHTWKFLQEKLVLDSARAGSGVRLEQLNSLGLETLDPESTQTGS